MKDNIEMTTEYVTIQFDKIIHISDSAILFLIDDIKQWIPKSLMFESPDMKYLTVSIKKWKIEQEGLEDYIMESM